MSAPKMYTERKRAALLQVVGYSLMRVAVVRK